MWILALSEFSFQYVPQRAIKGQAIVDFLVEHQDVEDELINIPGTLEVANLWIPPSKALLCREEWVQQKETTNNRAEYEALIIGLEILIELGVTEVEVFGDSELVINQLNGKYKCRNITMAGYYLAATQLLSYWGIEILVNYIPIESNAIANEMAQLASRAQIQERKFEGDIEVQKRNPPPIFERGFSLDIKTEEMEMKDWRIPIVQYLKDPSFPTSKKNRQQATKYVMWDKSMLRKTPDGLLLKCLGQEESIKVMTEVHEGICGAHQAVTKMRWLLRRYGYFWPEMEKDYKAYALGCDECQRHGPRQHVPSIPLNPAMCQGVEDLEIARIEALDKSQEGKRAVVRAYNKKVKLKTFKKGELVWKAIFPFRVQIKGFGKWSLTWEGPFIVNQVLDKGGYYLADVEGDLQKYPINAKFLKKYHPTLWDVKDCYIEEV
ncbi:unnamed protein product [Malus baccata var. baccata]